MPGSIVVTRPAGRHVDRGRAYKLEVDGEERGRVKAGDRLELPVEPGSHEVRARIDWTSSPAVEVTVADGQEVRLECEPQDNALVALVRSVFKRHDYVRLTASPTDTRPGPTTSA
jgi:hypothetical protein